MVIELRKGSAGGRELDLLLDRAGIEIVQVDAEQVEIARSAWRRYGKGRHAANRTMATAFPRTRQGRAGSPLLYKGDDLARPDL